MRAHYRHIIPLLFLICCFLMSCEKENTSTNNISNNNTPTDVPGSIKIVDANFKAYLLENFDTDKNGGISVDEAEAITSIDVSSRKISSLSGIEFMPNLQTLLCASNLLYSLDVSNNTKLTTLNCSNNPYLKEILLQKNQTISGLKYDIGVATIKYVILIDDEEFKGYLLVFFDTDKNGSISVDEAEAITSIDVSSRKISSLSGIEFMPNLQTLLCASNLLYSLDVSKNTALTELFCNENQLTSLDVSNNTALTLLSCEYNQLTSLDVSNNTELTLLNCYNNQLTSLDVSKNTALTDLWCSNNQLTSLDVSKNTELSRLYCFINQLTSLDVSGAAALKIFDCQNNQLTSLDVSNNTELTILNCYNNQLTSLDVSKNTALTELICNKNQLTSLDVSNNTALTLLACNYNQLTSLDVSNNTSLQRLHCNANPYLTEIWLQKNQTISEFMYDKNIATIKYKD